MASSSWDDGQPDYDNNQGQPAIKKVVFKPLSESRSASSMRGIAPEFHGVDLRIAAELGKVSIKVRDLINLEEGSVLQLNRVADEKVLILVNESPFAHGEIVVINDRFGVRVTSLVSEDDKEDSEKDLEG